jgi:hypothetical protein
MSRKQPSPVVIEDEEAHSEEAASAANEAQLPTDDTTEDGDWVNEDEDVEEHHDEDVELPTQLQPTQHSSPLTQTVPEPPSSPEAPQTWQCSWKAVVKKVDMPLYKVQFLR